MKRILIAVALLGSGMTYAQSNAPDPASLKIVKEHYTSSFGLLGAANFNKFRVTDNSNVSYDLQLGWGAGIWANFPLGRGVSLEPQLMYNSLPYDAGSAPVLVNNSTAGYLSVPLLLKFHLGKYFAITAGPQFDFLMSLNDDNNNWEKDDLKSTSIAGNFGLEFVPHARVVPFARYIHGFTSMDNTGNPNTVGKYYNQNFQAGLKFRLAGGKHILADSDGDGVVDKDDKCATQPGFARYAGCPIPDTDNDGIHDEADKCPNEAGLAKYNGCPIPDTDKDGINDEQDKCPTQPGVAKYNGCPIPDTDGDGINDENDKCPSVAGLAKYNGCPIPDTDGDGINDENDRCPDVAGVPEMNGCPAIEKFDAHEVTFATGKAVLTAAGKKELDLVVNYMSQHQGVSVKFDGYTDNSGSDKVNNPLSEKRAEAAKAYLVSKGIPDSRIVTEGHGSADPVADNKTAAGRAKNRRVEARVQ
jgi:outer membrane protein OmpA-like peptidoglycan-associated protein